MAKCIPDITVATSVANENLLRARKFVTSLSFYTFNAIETPVWRPNAAAPCRVVAAERGRAMSGSGGRTRPRHVGWWRRPNAAALCRAVAAERAAASCRAVAAAPCRIALMGHGTQVRGLRCANRGSLLWAGNPWIALVQVPRATLIFYYFLNIFFYKNSCNVIQWIHNSIS